ncbi:hypothetical protein CC80DRAFT_523764 [Byssothecium circinans]|uniref:Adipose-regulatory protein-domain-containing protein n=1 Tax=Byssothecium circinans TaxID=147558 RepID=A0A6A5U417_9PLEO|nr:hypothetical protein CC80DRAFT_523764 [Byssothecium circinans]
MEGMEDEEYENEHERENGYGSGDGYEDGDGGWRGVVRYIKETLLAPLRFLTSPLLLRTYLQTILLLLTSSILFGIAVLAYTTFYLKFIPVRGVEVPVFLQFETGPPPVIPPPLDAQAALRHGSGLRYPYGFADLKGLVSRQKYDVVVRMVVPRSERNIGAGNWMVGVEMRGGGRAMLGWEEGDVEDFSQRGWVGSMKDKITSEQEQRISGSSGGGGKEKEKHVVLARSRRPAILTYRSWMTELAYRALRLPLYVLGFGLESEVLVVKMMDGVSFEKGWRNVPSSLRLEIRSKTPLEVYTVSVKFIARLEGLRWVMYNHRILSAVVFTGLFWGVEVGVLMGTWGLFMLCFGGGRAKRDDDAYEGKRKKKGIKKEEGSGTTTPRIFPREDEAGAEFDTSAPPTPMSDTSRTFPTLPSQRPLHYSSSYTSPSDNKPRVKEERGEPGLESVLARVKEEEADDEEDDDFLLDEPRRGERAAELDSGIGTGLESSERDRGLGLGRRRSAGGRGR